MTSGLFTKPPPEALEAAFDYVREAPSLWVSEICAGDVFQENGDSLAVTNNYSYRSGYVCHAFLADGAVLASASSEDRRRRYDPYHCEETHRRFISWVITESPFHAAIINDDLSSVYNGAILSNGECGKQVAMWLFKALRTSYEEPYQVHTWRRFVDLGVDPLVAFIAATSRSDDGSYRGIDHCSVVGLPNNIHELAQALAVTSFTYSGCHYKSTYEMLYKASYYSDEQFMKPGGNVRQVKKPDGWGGYTYEKVIDGFEEEAEELITLTLKAKKINEDLEKEGKLVTCLQL